MSKRRSDPARQRFPGLTGNLVVDSVRGRLRIRKWPRPRGKPKSPVTRQQNEDFALRSFRTKYVAGSQMSAAIDATKGTGLYPRDLIMRAMTVGLFDVVLPDGQIITNRRDFMNPTTYQGAILLLDVNQNIGTGAAASPAWPLPLVDTAAFWDISAPTLLTIPNGVEIVNLWGGSRAATAGGGRAFMTFRQNGSVIGYDNRDTPQTVGVLASSGPVVVSEGDTLDTQTFLETGGILQGGGGTFFALEVLQAV